MFSRLIKTGGKGQPDPVPAVAAPADLFQFEQTRNVESPQARRRTGRTEVYAVRVRESFKGEILGLQAELQLERQKLKGKARRVTEGEVIDLMLEAFKVARRNGGADGNAVPLANDVWQGVHEIARRLQCSPADVVEQLVVQKVAELGLLPRK